MADSQSTTRQAKRTPVTLKIKFKSATLDQFIERYSVDVSHGGIFIRTKDPLPVGTNMRFEFQLKDATPLITGEGTVVWTREHDPSRVGVAPGMGVRFDRLGDGSQEVLDKILAQKSSRTNKGPKPPNFNEQPTRVAPSPLVAGLADEAAKPKMGRMAPPLQDFGGESTDGSGTDLTPLPKPMPFHSDAEDFPDEAFEEATKVASLDELAARSAREEEDEDQGEGDELFSGQAPAEAEKAEAEQSAAEKKAAEKKAAEKKAEAERKAAAARDAIEEAVRDELAERRAARQAEAEPAEAEAEEAKPAAEEKAAKEEQPGKKPLVVAKDQPEKEEKPKAEEEDDDIPSLARAREEKRKAAAKEASDQADKATARSAVEPAEAKKGSGMIYALIAAIVLVALVGGYYYTQKGKGKTTTASTEPAPATKPPTPDPNEVEPAVVTPPAVADAAPAAPVAPLELFEAKVVSVPAGAQVALVDGDQSGTAPFTLTDLDKAKPHKARVSLAGYLTQEVDLDPAAKGPVKVKLTAKPRILSITSTPPGATVYVDGVKHRHQTPTEIKLSAAQLAKKRVKVTLRKKGFERADQWVSTKIADGWSDQADAVTMTVSGALNAVVAVKPTGTKPTGTKPGETKPTGTKPTGTKPGETKPTGTKPGGTKPGGTKPGETKPGGTKPGETKPGETKPGETKPGETKPGETKPGETKVPEGPTPDWMK